MILKANIAILKWRRYCIQVCRVLFICFIMIFFQQKLLNCKHKQELDCGMPLNGVKCVERCEMLLDCNHICNLPCHKESSHKDKLCLQPCRRSPCLENHPCPKRCHEPCGNCLQEVEKKLPCGHQVRVTVFSLQNVTWKRSFFTLGQNQVFHPPQGCVLSDQSGEDARLRPLGHVPVRWINCQLQV